MQVVAELLTNKEVCFFQNGSHDFVHPSYMVLIFELSNAERVHLIAFISAFDSGEPLVIHVSWMRNIQTATIRTVITPAATLILWYHIYATWHRLGR
jgi:hypothetical protein